jgi:hypothetical protein
MIMDLKCFEDDVSRAMNLFIILDLTTIITAITDNYKIGCYQVNLIETNFEVDLDYVIKCMSIFQSWVGTRTFISQEVKRVRGIAERQSQKRTD